MKQLFTILLFFFLIQASFSQKGSVSDIRNQEAEDIIYIRRYNVSVDVANTDFEYNKKIKGLAHIESGSMINFYGEESKAIKEMYDEIGVTNLDSFYLPTFKSYLFKSKEKVGNRNAGFLYFGEFVYKNDTISTFAREFKSDKLIEEQIIKIVDAVRPGDVKGDIFYFKEFEFTGGIYLRPCKFCPETTGIKLTNDGSPNPQSHHRSALSIEYEITDQNINEYIEAEQKKRSMKHKSVISTKKDGVWQIFETHNPTTDSEIEYEYVLKKENKLFKAKYTSPNYIEFRRMEIENYLATFQVK